MPLLPDPRNHVVIVWPPPVTPVVCSSLLRLRGRGIRRIGCSPPHAPWRRVEERLASEAQGTSFNAPRAYDHSGNHLMRSEANPPRSWSVAVHCDPTRLRSLGSRSAFLPLAWLCTFGSSISHLCLQPHLHHPHIPHHCRLFSLTPHHFICIHATTSCILFSIRTMSCSVWHPPSSPRSRVHTPPSPRSPPRSRYCTAPALLLPATVLTFTLPANHPHARPDLHDPPPCADVYHYAGGPPPVCPCVCVSVCAIVLVLLCIVASIPFPAPVSCACSPLVPAASLHSSSPSSARSRHAVQYAPKTRSQKSIAPPASLPPLASRKNSVARYVS